MSPLHSFQTLLHTPGNDLHLWWLQLLHPSWQWHFCLLVCFLPFFVSSFFSSASFRRFTASSLVLSCRGFLFTSVGLSASMKHLLSSLRSGVSDNCGNWGTYSGLESSCDRNGTCSDEATFQEGVACLLIGKSPVSWNPPFRCWGLKLASQSYLTSIGISSLLMFAACVNILYLPRMAFHACFTGPYTPTYNVCNTCVVLDGRSMRWTLFSLLIVTRFKLMWEKWPSNKRTTGKYVLCCWHEHFCKPGLVVSFSIHPLSLTEYIAPAAPLLSKMSGGVFLYILWMEVTGCVMLSHTHAQWCSYAQIHRFYLAPI